MAVSVLMSFSVGKWRVTVYDVGDGLVGVSISRWGRNAVSYYLPPMVKEGTCVELPKYVLDGVEGLKEFTEVGCDGF